MAMIAVRFHGRGGQGAKIASRMLGRSGFLSGLYVQDFAARERVTAEVGMATFHTNGRKIWKKGKTHGNVN